MGWPLAVLVLPILFAVAATYVLLKLALLVLRLAFAASALIRR
jgi:hypothetical protein